MNPLKWLFDPETIYAFLYWITGRPHESKKTSDQTAQKEKKILESLYSQTKTPPRE